MQSIVADAGLGPAPIHDYRILHALLLARTCKLTPAVCPLLSLTSAKGNVSLLSDSSVASSLDITQHIKAENAAWEQAGAQGRSTPSADIFCHFACEMSMSSWVCKLIHESVSWKIRVWANFVTLGRRSYSYFALGKSPHNRAGLLWDGTSEESCLESKPCWRSLAATLSFERIRCRTSEGRFSQGVAGIEFWLSIFARRSWRSFSTGCIFWVNGNFSLGSFMFVPSAGEEFSCNYPLATLYVPESAGICRWELIQPGSSNKIQREGCMHSSDRIMHKA